VLARGCRNPLQGLISGICGDQVMGNFCQLRSNCKSCHPLRVGPHSGRPVGRQCAPGRSAKLVDRLGSNDTSAPVTMSKDKYCPY
jgi:hypothetical protein